jgi:hypothetical protein
MKYIMMEGGQPMDSEIDLYTLIQQNRLDGDPVPIDPTAAAMDYDAEGDRYGFLWHFDYFGNI